MSNLRLVGIILLLWAYGMNVHGVLGAWHEARMSPEQAAREHLEAMARNPKMDMPASAPVSTAGIVLTTVLLLAGVLLAVIPIRRGDWYGVWATLVVWLAIAGPRIARDPRCWQVLDPNKHGCHTFMLSVVIAVAGMVFAALGRGKQVASA